MAGIQVAYVDAVMIEKQRLGYMAVSLSNFALTTEPQITAGSKIEIGGALFEFTALESITGWAGIANSSAVYILLTVAGASVTASFTTTAPTWSDSKQGWYTGGVRSIGGLYKDSGGNYTKKWLCRAGSGGIQTIKEYGDGTMAVLPASAIVALVTSAAFAWTMADAGHVAILTGATYVIPAGLYMIGSSIASGLRFEVFEEGAWRDMNISGGMMVVSDGVNVRAYGMTNITIYLKKLA